MCMCVSASMRTYVGNAHHSLSLSTAGSTSSFTIAGSDLQDGLNVIGLRVTANGAVRTLNLSAQKTRGETQLTVVSSLILQHTML